MDKEIARLIYVDWAAGYGAGSRSVAAIAVRAQLTALLPHAYPPMVPVALRGPNWGKQ